MAKKKKAKGMTPPKTAPGKGKMAKMPLTPTGAPANAKGVGGKKRKKASRPFGMK